MSSPWPSSSSCSPSRVRCVVSTGNPRCFGYAAFNAGHAGNAMAGALLHELRGATVEAPHAVVAVQRVVVATDHLNRPSRLALEDQDHVADRGGFAVGPFADERVD